MIPGSVCVYGVGISQPMSTQWTLRALADTLSRCGNKTRPLGKTPQVPPAGDAETS